METVILTQAHIDALVAGAPSAAVASVTCPALDTAIQVVSAIQGSTGNAWVRMGLGIAVAALQAYKAAHCK